jgi:hypothetical protein
MAQQAGALGTPQKPSAKRVPSGRNLLEFTPQPDGRHVPDAEEETPAVARNKHDFNSITEALVQAEALRQELERVQMGLMLMTFSVEKLMDIVTVEPACCPSIFDFLVPRTQQSIGRDSTGPYSSSRGAVTGTDGGQGLSRIAAAGARANPFKNHKIRQAGYKNLNGNANMFSIESNDEEDEL